MQRLQRILVKGQQSVAGKACLLRVQALSLSTLSHGPLTAMPRAVVALHSLPATVSLLRPPQQPALRFFGSVRLGQPQHPMAVPARQVHTSNGTGFLRAARLSWMSTSSSNVVPGSLRFTPFCVPHRCMSVRGKEGGSEEAKADGAKENANNEDEETANRNKTEQEAKDGEEEEAQGNGKKSGKKKPRRQQQKKNSFADHIRGLKEDYMKFPDIYNSANGINFIVFTVFCLCSTGSNTEEKWWLDQWGLDNTFRPWNWILHSFLTNNFLSMTYAMMLLHTLCHAMIPTIGSKGLLAYVLSTAAISGGLIWLGNFLYYGDKQAPEKQFGPWDVIHALFVMYYLQYAITPIAVLNSFNSWLKYAVWVGEICILYFDWQPTLVGTLVGLALCKGVPRFRVKPLA